jgi:hypothetical protein
MSAVATLRPSRTRAVARPALAGPDALVTTAVAAVLALLAFTAQGGTSLGANTDAQVLLVVAGCGLGAAAIAAPSRHARAARLHGGWALALFAAFAVVTALSILWSLDPSTSWTETSRTLAYLAVFGGAIALVRLLPGRWAAVLHGVALACMVVCGYALLTKVFPETLAADEVYARLRAPFGYWNAVGLMAASGVPPLLWLAARRSGRRTVNALAYPGLGLLLVCLLLAYSRGALLALVAGLACWFVVVPLRLRGAVALIVAAAGAGGVVAWAFGQPGLTEDNLEASARTDAGLQLGVLLALLVVVLLAAGLAIGVATAARPPRERTRRLAGALVLAALAVAVIGGVAGVASSPGGISKAWHELTDPHARTPANTPDRLTATASVRARYWDEAFKVHALSPLVGVGAGAYGLVRRRFREFPLDVQHAHGWVPQTLADLGWLGLLVSLAAAAAWLAAATRALGLRRRDRGLVWDAERVGLATLATVVVVFAVHSALDWTWFVPANAVLALLCAGWVAGRGPLRERLATEGPTGLVPAAERAGLIAPRRVWGVRERLVRWRPSPWRAVAAALVLALGAAVCWTTVQPLRAEHAGDAATIRLQAGATDAAEDIATIGTQRNPLSPQPLWELAAARAAGGDLRGAERALGRAVEVQPADPEGWRRLGRFELSALGAPEQALTAFQTALYLDPKSAEARSDVLETRQALAATAP